MPLSGLIPVETVCLQHGRNTNPALGHSDRTSLTQSADAGALLLIKIRADVMVSAVEARGDPESALASCSTESDLHTWSLRPNHRCRRRLRRLFDFHFNRFLSNAAQICSRSRPPTAPGC